MCWWSKLAALIALIATGCLQLINGLVFCWNVGLEDMALEQGLEHGTRFSNGMHPPLAARNVFLRT